MPDKPLEQACDARVCIHTDQILDSCMDKDCVEDLRVYLTRESQAALDRSTGAKTRCAELLFARVEVEPLAYKRGHYAVDLTFYYRILGDATVGGTRPVTITGLAVFAKRVALYGGRGKAKTFSSFVASFSSACCMVLNGWRDVPRIVPPRVRISEKSCGSMG